MSRIKDRVQPLDRICRLVRKGMCLLHGHCYRDLSATGRIAYRGAIGSCLMILLGEKQRLYQGTNFAAGEFEIRCFRGPKSFRNE
jgi:hypothetical protein